MKHRLIRLVAFALLLTPGIAFFAPGSGYGTLPALEKKLTVRLNASKAIKAKSASEAKSQMPMSNNNIAEPFALKDGNAIVSVQPSPMKMRAAIIKDGQAHTVAIGGFLTFSLANTGTTPWKNITVTATFVIAKMPANGAKVKLNACGFVKNNPAGEAAVSIATIKEMIVSAPGTYTLTSNPYDIPPGGYFSGGAMIILDALDCGEGLSWVEGQVGDIKLNL